MKNLTKATLSFTILCFSGLVFAGTSLPIDLTKNTYGNDLNSISDKRPTIPHFIKMTPNQTHEVRDDTHNIAIDKTDNNNPITLSCHFDPKKDKNKLVHPSYIRSNQSLVQMVGADNKTTMPVTGYVQATMQIVNDAGQPNRVSDEDWPAFWLHGTTPDVDTGKGWPMNGEIDLLEHNAFRTQAGNGIDFGRLMSDKKNDEHNTADADLNLIGNYTNDPGTNFNSNTTEDLVHYRSQLMDAGESNAQVHTYTFVWQYSQEGSIGSDSKYGAPKNVNTLKNYNTLTLMMYRDRVYVAQAVAHAPKTGFDNDQKISQQKVFANFKNMRVIFDATSKPAQDGPKGNDNFYDYHLKVSNVKVGDSLPKGFKIPHFYTPELDPHSVSHTKGNVKFSWTCPGDCKNVDVEDYNHVKLATSDNGSYSENTDNSRALTYYLRSESVGSDAQIDPWAAYNAESIIVPVPAVSGPSNNPANKRNCTIKDPIGTYDPTAGVKLSWKSNCFVKVENFDYSRVLPNEGSGSTYTDRSVLASKNTSDFTYHLVAVPNNVANSNNAAGSSDVLITVKKTSSNIPACQSADLKSVTSYISGQGLKLSWKTVKPCTMNVSDYEHKPKFSTGKTSYTDSTVKSPSSSPSGTFVYYLSGAKVTVMAGTTGPVTYLQTLSPQARTVTLSENTPISVIDYLKHTLQQQQPGLNTYTQDVSGDTGQLYTGPLTYYVASNGSPIQQVQIPKIQI